MSSLVFTSYISGILFTLLLNLSSMHIKVMAEIKPKSFVRFMYRLQFTKEFRFAGFIGPIFGIVLITVALLHPNDRTWTFLIIGPLTMVSTPLLLLYVYKKIFDSKYQGIINYEITGDKLSTSGTSYNSLIEWNNGSYNLKEYQDWLVVFKQSEKGKIFSEIIPKNALNEGQIIELRSVLGKWFI